MNTAADYIIGATEGLGGLTSAIREHQEQQSGYHPFVTQVAKFVQDRMANGESYEYARAAGGALLQEMVAASGMAQSAGAPPPGMSAPGGPMPQGAPVPQGAPAPRSASLGELAALPAGAAPSAAGLAGLGGLAGRAGPGPSPQATPAPTASPMQRPPAPSTFDMQPRADKLNTFTKRDAAALQMLQPLVGMFQKTDLERLKADEKRQAAEMDRQFKDAQLDKKLTARADIELAGMNYKDRALAQRLLIAMRQIQANAENARLAASTKERVAETKTGASVEVEAKKEAGRNARAQLANERAMQVAEMAKSAGILRNMVQNNPVLMGMSSIQEQEEAMLGAVAAFAQHDKDPENIPKLTTPFPEPIGGVDVFKKPPGAAAPPKSEPTLAPKPKAPTGEKQPPGAGDPTKARKMGRGWVVKTAKGTWVQWKGD